MLATVSPLIVALSLVALRSIVSKCTSCLGAQFVNTLPLRDSVSSSVVACFSLWPVKIMTKTFTRQISVLLSSVSSAARRSFLRVDFGLAIATPYVSALHRIVTQRFVWSIFTIRGELRPTISASISLALLGKC